jgi:hypothetical protein
VLFTMAGRACIFSPEQFWGRATQLTSHDSKPESWDVLFCSNPHRIISERIPGPSQGSDGRLSGMEINRGNE